MRKFPGRKSQMEEWENRIEKLKEKFQEMVDDDLITADKYGLLETLCTSHYNQETFPYGRNLSDVDYEMEDEKVFVKGKELEKGKNVRISYTKGDRIETEIVPITEDLKLNQGILYPYTKIGDWYLFSNCIKDMTVII